MSDNLPEVAQASGGEVTPYSDPKAEVDRAGKMAKVLQDVVKQAGLSRKFGGQKEHLFFEAWQTIGRFFNCTPATEWSRPIMSDGKIVGWEAKAVVTNSSGVIVAAAESMCAIDEPNWKGKPHYAVRSMAQTRAASKALRQAFAWVAVLAGYSATPAEEMSEDFTKAKTPKPASRKQNEPVPKPCTKAQFDELADLAVKTWGEEEQPQARLGEMVAWLRKGPKLNATEAQDLIDNWDGRLAEYAAHIEAQNEQFPV